MRLTSMTDYALRLLMYVAQQPDRLCTISEVARVHGLSRAHLMKITHQLAQAGFIETVRGKGGGMRLAAAPEDIALGAVVRNMEGGFVLVECLASGSHCALTGRCRLTGAIEGALQSFMRHLDQYTLADLLPAADAGDGASIEPQPIRFSKRPAARTG